MTGKNVMRGILAIGLLCTALVAFSSCSLVPSSQVLVVSNASDYTIYAVYINQYGVGTKATFGDNVLSEGESIAPGAEKSFYLAPYSQEVGLIVDTDSENARIVLDSPSGYCYFTFEYQNSLFNESVVATFDGSVITVSGSSAVFYNID
jgi:hypothetical protein